MFILGLNLISDACFTNTLPPKRTYERVDFYGNCTVDGIHARSSLLTESEILAINSEDSYGLDTLFLGNMENTLESGSIILYVDKPITAYRIRRKVIGDSLNPVLVDLPYNEDLKSYTDYTVANHKNYTYTLSGIFSDETGTIEGRGLEGNSSVDFYAYILTDMLTYPPTQYIFTMDIELSDIEVVTDYKVYENYTQFPVIHFGQTEYKTTKLKTMPYRFEEGQGNGGYVIDKTVLDDVIDFLSNQNIKLLRLPSGEVLSVVCSNISYKYLDDIGEQPFHINFDITQVSDV